MYSAFFKISFFIIELNEYTFNTKINLFNLKYVLNIIKKKRNSFTLYV